MLEEDQLLDILKKYWGFDSFRYNQQDIISSIINGKDTLAILPTGAGKSLCYQIPGLYHEGVTLVISPLIALMKDQIAGLKKRSIKADGIYSGQTKRQQDIILDNAVYGDQKFLFVSPERLKTNLFKERFKRMNTQLVAIDEAHCISEWGHDFRPEYRLIAELRDLKPNLKFIALTATATQPVVEDIIQNLEFEDYKSFISSPIRSNLSYNVLVTESKREVLTSLLQDESECVIIYCNTRKGCKDLERHLNARGKSCRSYHGGMSKRDREKCIEAWEKDETKVIIATKAFGMGIDKSNVRKVIHYNLPQTLEAYVQEAGRGGRDGERASAILLYNNSDKLKLEKLIAENFPSLDFIKSIFAKLCSYLSIASGTSEYEFHPFYLTEFASKYNLKIIKLLSALKFLHQSDIIYLSDAILHPAQLKLSESAIKKLLGNPKLSIGMASFIKILLRNYEGIFLDYSVIDEKDLAKRHQTSQEKVVRALEWLAQKGYGDYKSSFEGHTVSFMEYRYDSEQLPLKTDLWNKRKKRLTDSVEKMLSFVANDTCRQIIIAEYFGFEEDDCKICDNCIKKYNNWDNSTLQFKIENHLSIKPMSLIELSSHFEIGMRDRIKEVLTEMESEREIAIQSNLIKLVDNAR